VALAVFDAAGGPAGRQYLDDHPSPARRAVARRFQPERAFTLDMIAFGGRLTAPSTIERRWPGCGRHPSFRV
jgi:hypothetical protein